MKRAIAVKLQFWRGQRTKIGHHGGLAMGQDRDPVEFCDGQSDWRCSAGVWRRVGWLPPFQRFLNPADGEGGGCFKNQVAQGQHHGAVAGIKCVKR